MIRVNLAGNCIHAWNCMVGLHIQEKYGYLHEGLPYEISIKTIKERRQIDMIRVNVAGNWPLMPGIVWYGYTHKKSMAAFMRACHMKYH